MKKKNTVVSIVIAIFITLGLYQGSVLGTSATSVYAETVDSYQQSGILKFKKSRQLELGDLDKLRRTTYAHIQLKTSDQPTKKRNEKLTINPSGWHNYKFYYGDGSKKSWLMNRGHLVGYQLSGLNDEKRNLVTMTVWLNTGDYKGMDSGNSEGMLYYENKLDSWLDTHPNYWLDYKVTPNYTGDELVARQISLQYVGIDKEGNLLQINLGGGKESQDNYGITHVTLDNTSSNASIDYNTGIATNIVKSASEQKSEAASAQSSSSVAASQAAASQAAAEQAQAEQVQAQQTQAEQRTVYVARQGTADVYWYNKSSMPANTNFGNVVQMTEADATSQGKRHTSKE